MKHNPVMIARSTPRKIQQGRSTCEPDFSHLPFPSPKIPIPYKSFITMSWFSSIFSPVQCEAPAESKPQEPSHDEHKEEAPAPDHKEGEKEEKEEGEEKEEEPEEEEPEDVSLFYEREG
jgi:hypothetical protein